MKTLFLILCILAFNVFSLAQNTSPLLAKGNNISITVKDLPPPLGEAYANLEQNLLNTRKDFLEAQIGEILLAYEAAVRRTTVDKLLNLEVTRRVPNPTPKEIQDFYDQNRAEIGNATLEEIRPQIVSFLRQNAEDKVFSQLLSRLKTKHKVVYGVNINSASFKPTDVLATVVGQPIPAVKFNDYINPRIYEMRYKVYEETLKTINELIYNNLIFTEAKSFNVQPEEIITREISDKMKDFTDEEKFTLQNALREKLYAKYQVEILLPEPPPFAQKISVDDDPFSGSPTAPVTVVMFTDFECPACKATHPVLKEVLAEYGDKIRFVVRDYPLVSLHKNALKAAQAAQAAQAQGKFFEYIELLYKNQNLDLVSLKKYADEIGLNRKKFDLDLNNPKFIAEIKKDMADGNFYGITSTPTIFINGVKVRRLSAESFRQAIERALKK